ncbi:zinc finger protein 503 [Protobothrops mucrosquamatus]|uniref:zinc finger protein 503 n=1 Tax=Protobothrops mucrosquamatus TaxID=103944 RepID=UPI000775B9C0|nr:zinc finger protein 503 [Protobothrops mucrosquamatus]
MITAPALSALRSSPRGGGGGGGGGGGAAELGGGAELPWQSGVAGILPGGGGGGIGGKAFLHAIPPSDPLRQANRLPIRVLKMLTARTGHILHPEYLQPLPSTPVSPIELDAKKSPLALLAQTCSQIGKPDPSPSSKLSSVTSGGGGDKEAAKAAPLKLSDIGAEDKSSFKPYAKPGADKKDASAGGGASSSSSSSSGGSSGGGSGGSGEKSGFRVPSATCPPFTPRTGSPSSSASACSPGLLPGGESKGGGEAEKKEAAEGGKGASDGSGRLAAVGGVGALSAAELSQAHEGAKGLLAGVASAVSCSTADSPCSAVPSSVAAAAAAAASVLGSAGLVAPVSPYKPGQTVFPLPPAGMSYPGSLAGAYAGYPPQFLQPGVALDPGKAGGAGGGGGGKAAGSSPLAGASPPSVMTASLCRDPYCLSYHCATSHLAAASPCAHEQALKAGGYPLVYSAPPLPAGPPSLAGHPLYPYGFLLPNDPQPHSCNWVSANGPCDKRFATSEELLSHLRTHTAFPGPAEKLLAGYPSSSSLAAAAAAAAMACHMHVPSSAAAAGGPGSPGALALRSPHHAFGLGSRYHPYSKSPLPTPGAPVPVPAATGPYYSPYALYGQRLTTASALGYQ